MNRPKHTGEFTVELIKSLSFDQIEIIKNILKLYVPCGCIDCDPTYSVGRFYHDRNFNSTGIKEPYWRLDLHPCDDSVMEGDSRCLPIDSESIRCEMFDPPFLATSGKSLQENDDRNIIAHRFGVYPNEESLHQFYIDSMKEAYRILIDDGILIFKCQDKIAHGKQYISHVFIMNEAVKIGFYPEDLFILGAKTRLVADWQLKNQKHARKFHCYFWVFRKTPKVIKYV